jgi:hypothetical protein
MQDHVPPDKLSNYFDAQCLTDDVMAHTLLGSREPFKILVAGSFHTDYRDGAVARLAARAPSETVAAVRIVDASDYREPELPSVLWDERYGPVADFVVFVNEPVAR